MAIKKSMEALVAYVNTDAVADLTVAELATSEAFLALVTAKKGGFSGEDQFVTIDGNKVARVCALTGGVFSHDNSDKTVSFFYKNGSYCIGAEVLKANERKQWEMDKEDDLQVIEDEMMNGDINPKEWKEKATAINAREFQYTMSEDDKADINETFGAYNTKEAYTEAYNAGEVRPFSDFEEEIKHLRSLAPKREVVEDEA